MTVLPFLPLEVFTHINKFILWGLCEDGDFTNSSFDKFTPWGDIMDVDGENASCQDCISPQNVEPKSLEAQQCLLVWNLLRFNSKWLANVYSEDTQLINAKIVCVTSISKVNSMFVKRKLCFDYKLQVMKICLCFTNTFDSSGLYFPSGNQVRQIFSHASSLQIRQKVSGLEYKSLENRFEQTWTGRLHNCSSLEFIRTHH